MKNLVADALSASNPITLYGNEFWGIGRHELIAGAANKYLAAPAKSEVERLLNPINSVLPDIAGWADKIKRHRPDPNSDDADTVNFLQDDRNKNNAQWHFVDLPLDAERYDRERYQKFTREDDVVQILGEAVRVLQGKSDRFSELNALRLVTHLTGDVFQPVHVACGYVNEAGGGTPTIERDPDLISDNDLESDRGGNSLILPFSNSVSLHSYWDSKLGGGGGDADGGDADFAADSDDGEFSSEQKQEFIEKLFRMIERDRPEGDAAGDGSSAADSFENALIPSADLKFPERWASHWANNSLELARTAYESLEIVEVISKNKYKVSWDGKSQYDERCGKIVVSQLKEAGKSLALLLNTIWS